MTAQKGIGPAGAASNEPAGRAARPAKPHLLAVPFATQAEADAALAELDGLTLDDAVVVVKQASGHVDLHQTRGTSPGEGAVAGGTVGLLAGLLLGIPVGAAVVGIAAGGGWGLRDTGIRDERLRTLAGGLEPRQALLCLLVPDKGLDELRERLAGYDGVFEASVGSADP